ncbi:hypothetical protein Esti_000600 [Eimeria stiedai]
MAALGRCSLLALVSLAAAVCCPTAARTLVERGGRPLFEGAPTGGPLFFPQPSGSNAACGSAAAATDAAAGCSVLPPHASACFLWPRRQTQQQQQQQQQQHRLRKRCWWSSCLGVCKPKEAGERDPQGGPSSPSRGFRVLPEKSAAYAVLSIPVEVALHPVVHRALAQATKLLQRLELLLLLSGTAAATALAMAVAIPRLILFRGGADLLLLPAGGLILLPFLLLLLAIIEMHKPQHQEQQQRQQIAAGKTAAEL